MVHLFQLFFSGGGVNTCLRARATNRTSITLCSNQTLETDRKRGWQADKLDMYIDEGETLKRLKRT